jgi:hypothetical protein
MQCRNSNWNLIAKAPNKHPMDQQELEFDRKERRQRLSWKEKRKGQHKLFGGSCIKRCTFLLLRSVKNVERHVGHKALENLQRFNHEDDNGRAESNLEFLTQTVPEGLPAGETKPPTDIVESPAAGRSAVTAAASKGVADVIHAYNTERVSDQEATLHPINGAVAQSRQYWIIWSSVSDVFGPSCDVGAQQWSPIDYFYMMFSMTHLQDIVRLTNEVLSNNNKAPATVGEILKFFGVMLLCTEFEFRSRSIIVVDNVCVQVYSSSFLWCSKHSKSNAF